MSSAVSAPRCGVDGKDCSWRRAVCLLTCSSLTRPQILSNDAAGLTDEFVLPATDAASPADHSTHNIRLNEHLQYLLHAETRLIVPFLYPASAWAPQSRLLFQWLRSFEQPQHPHLWFFCVWPPRVNQANNSCCTTPQCYPPVILQLLLISNTTDHHSQSHQTIVA